MGRVSSDFKNKMFTWLTSTLSTTRLDFMEDYFEEIIFSHFHEEKYIEMKIDLTQEHLDEFKTKQNDWLGNYYFEKWALYYLQTLDKMENMKEEQIVFCEENIEYDSVREYYVDKLIAAEKFTKAIDLLEEIKMKFYMVWYL